MLTLIISAGGRAVNFSVKLPIIISKFTEPLSLKAPDFFQQWRQLEAFNQQTIIKSPRPVDIAWVSKVLSTGFRLAVLQGVDPNTNNLVAAGTFMSSAGTLQTLVRMETNAAAAMYRVTVRASNETITTLLKQQLEVQLG